MAAQRDRSRPTPSTRVISRWCAALLGAALTLGGSVASSATPDAAAPAIPQASVAASDAELTSLALAMPIVVPERSTGLISATELEAYTAPSGELTRQLDAAIGRPVALGVDPMILASIRILGMAAPESATTWLERLEGAANETFSLAYADADVAALSQAGMVDLSVPTDFALDPTVFPAPGQVPNGTPSPAASPGTAGTTGASAAPSPAPTPSPTPADPLAPVVPTGQDLVNLPFSLDDVMWPRDDTVVASDLPVFTASGASVTIVDSSNASHPRDVIPSSAAVGDHRVLVSNNDISNYLRDAASAPTDSAWESSMAQLTAALIGWTGGSSTVFATFDRDIPSAGNRIAATLTRLAITEGVALSSVSSTLGQLPVQVGIVDQPVAPERIGALQGALQLEPATTAFASVLDDPTLITGEQRRRIFALASTAWVTSSEDWQEAVAGHLDQASRVLRSVHVLDSSTINLLSDTGDIPITISNALPHPVTVSVHVWANRAVLDVLDDSVSVTIEAESQARAAVPVQSIANGTGTLVVTLASPTGVEIGSPLYVTTNVQAGWETAFTTAVAAVVLLVFIIGIARTVARRRREARQSE